MFKEKLTNLDLNSKDKKLSQSEIELRSRLASALWEKFLKDEMKDLLEDQMKRVVVQEDMESVYFCRGAMNALWLMEEWFKKRNSEFEQNNVNKREK